jgi:beta-glucosidase
MKYATLVTIVTLLGAPLGAGCGGGGGKATGQGGSTGAAGLGGLGGAGGGGIGNLGGTTITCPGLGGSAPTGMPACTSNPSDYQYKFQDPCAPIEDRITDLLAQLTPDEKLGLMSEYQFPVARLGIPAFTTFTEGLHGVGWAGDNTTPATAGSTNVLYLTGTQFPQASGLAESWDPDALSIVGATTAYEARIWNAKRAPNDQGRGVGVVMRAPLVDLGRDPRWGRTEESSGEDPYLVSQLSAGYIAGLHGSDPTYLMAASTLKHWLANNNETGRSTSSSDFDQRDLLEYYAVPFQHAVRASHAQGIMEAYNKINGEPSATSSLLKSLVIGDWGFDGVLSTDAWVPNTLVSDQHDYPDLPTAVAAIVKAGTPLVLQDQSGFRDNVSKAYTQNLMSIDDIDAALRGNLRVRFRVGDLDPPDRVPGKKILGTETPWNEMPTIMKAQDVTRRTVVLLKNANNKLPLSMTGLTKVAVVGPRANSVQRDWYGGLAPYKITVAQGLATKLNGVATIVKAADATDAAAVTAATGADLTILALGNDPTCGPAPPEANTTPWGVCPSMYDGREAVDRKFIALDPVQVTLAQKVFAANPNTVVVLVSSFPQALGWVADNAPAIVHIANSGQETGTAIADVLFGDYNPGGRTAMTWYASDEDLPSDMLQYDIRAGKGLTYQYFKGTPLYPFGYGLSYTTFAYSNLVVGAATLAMCDETAVSADVQNSGTRDGDEVVQLYVSFPDTNLARPAKQLRGFKRIHLAAGEKQTVSFPLRGDALTYWDQANQRFALESGHVSIQVGASSTDVRLTGSLMTAP